MKAVQIVMGEELLKAVDREARRARVNRSELVRRAIRAHLKSQRVHELETRHRLGYESFPPHEFEAWDRVQAWPDE